MITVNISVFKTIERVLLLVVIILCAYAAFLFKEERVGRISKVGGVTSQPIIPPAQSPLMPMHGTSESLSARSIFDYAPVENGGQIADGGEALQTLPAQFKVVGILVGNPSEVVIEDTAQQQSYFVKQGQPNGPFEVLKVSAKSAVIAYEGQTFEVHPLP